MKTLLEVKNLSKKYEGFALKDISFSLDRGYIMGFIGPNGAGKTTTMKLIMNLIKRDQGEINIFGLNNGENDITIKDRIGFIYDENCFYGELTIVEMKKIIAPFYSKWDDYAFNQYIKSFELPLKKKIKALSKGMKMKFSLAVALSHHAELLIMDEPTSGLDPVFRNEILDILRDMINDEDKGVLFSTHITSDLDKIADYVTFIDKGELLISTTKEELYENYAVIKGEKRQLNESLQNKLIGLHMGNYGFEGLIANVKDIKDLKNTGIVIERPTLEDIMLYMVRGKKHA